MKTIEVMAEAIKRQGSTNEGSSANDFFMLIAKAALQSIKEPDPHVVAAVADKLNMEPTKVAAVWMLMVERCLE